MPTTPAAAIVGASSAKLTPPAAGSTPPKPPARPPAERGLGGVEFGAQLGPLDLAAGRLRQLVDEVDDAGGLVGGGLGHAVLAQLGDQLLARLAVAEDDDRAD